VGPIITGIGASLIAFTGAKRLSNMAEQSSPSPEVANSKSASSSGRSPRVLAMSAPVLKAA